MNVQNEKTQTEIEEETTLKSTHKWTTETKVNLLKIEGRERNRGRGFMKRMREAWDDIYENSAISAKHNEIMLPQRQFVTQPYNSKRWE